jgi:hypothetical protein
MLTGAFQFKRAFRRVEDNVALPDRRTRDLLLSTLDPRPNWMLVLGASSQMALSVPHESSVYSTDRSAGCH